MANTRTMLRRRRIAPSVNIPVGVNVLDEHILRSIRCAHKFDTGNDNLAESAGSERFFRALAHALGKPMNDVRAATLEVSRGGQAPRRGEVGTVELSPVPGHEQAEARPAAIVSTFNRSAAGLVTVRIALER